MTRRGSLPFVIQFSSVGLQLRNAIGKHFQEAAAECSALQQFRFITAQKRNKNLQDILVHARLTSAKQVTFKNNKLALRQIPYLWGYTTNRYTNIGAPIAQRLTLETGNVVYAIQYFD